MTPKILFFNESAKNLNLNFQFTFLLMNGSIQLRNWNNSWHFNGSKIGFCQRALSNVSCFWALHNSSRLIVIYFSMSVISFHLTFTRRERWRMWKLKCFRTYNFWSAECCKNIILTSNKLCMKRNENIFYRYANICVWEASKPARW